MGINLNPGNTLFQQMKIKTYDSYVCVTRPRRFEKSVDANRKDKVV